MTIMLAQNSPQPQDEYGTLHIGGAGQTLPGDNLALTGYHEPAALGSVDSGGRQLPMGPDICVFWCVVALGGLLQGQPPWSVSYCRAWYGLLRGGATGNVEGNPMSNALGSEPMAFRLGLRWTSVR